MRGGVDDLPDMLVTVVNDDRTPFWAGIDLAAVSLLAPFWEFARLPTKKVLPARAFAFNRGMTYLCTRNSWFDNPTQALREFDNARWFSELRWTVS